MMATKNESESSEAAQYIEGTFYRNDYTEALEVIRPDGISYPIDVRVQWRTDGEGRDALNEMLAEVMVLELDHLAQAVANGKKFHLEPLKEIAKRGGWHLDSQLKLDPAKYTLSKDGETAQTTGERLDLLLALELAVRCAIKPFENQTVVPSWVERARLVHPKLLTALQGKSVFAALNSATGTAQSID